MCRCRGFLIGGAKKGHGKISWPNPIEVLQQNPADNGHEGRRLARPRWARTGLLHCNMIGDTLTLMPG
jgi:hypothetical protein